MKTERAQTKSRSAVKFSWKKAWFYYVMIYELICGLWSIREWALRPSELFHFICIMALNSYDIISLLLIGGEGAHAFVRIS